VGCEAQLQLALVLQVSRVVFWAWQWLCVIAAQLVEESTCMFELLTLYATREVAAALKNQRRPQPALLQPTAPGVSDEMPGQCSLTNDQ